MASFPSRMRGHRFSNLFHAAIRIDIGPMAYCMTLKVSKSIDTSSSLHFDVTSLVDFGEFEKQNGEVPMTTQIIKVIRGHQPFQSQ